MKKQLILIYFFVLLNFVCKAQDKTNPILFTEMIIGYSNGSSKGLTGGGSLNYQRKNNLFTYRYLEVTNNKKVGQFFYITLYTNVETIKEQALLFGKRYVEENISYSYSAGISYIDRDVLINDDKNVLEYENSKSIGFPFELNIKWFNSTKQRYRIYELIPIGKPVSFANSIGFKLYGDISKTSFFGLALTIGLGWHKNY